MKKKILIGSIMAVLILVSMSVLPVVNAQTEKTFENIVKPKGYFSPPGFWLEFFRILLTEGLESALDFLQEYLVNCFN